MDNKTAAVLLATLKETLHFLDNPPNDPAACAARAREIRRAVMMAVAEAEPNPSGGDGANAEGGGG